MFEFTRESTNYTIKYANFGDDDMLVCQYSDNGQNRYRAMMDTYDLTNQYGKYYNDETAFLEAFLTLLNGSLDNAHSNGDESSENPQERLTALIKNNLSFDGNHVILN